MENFQIGLFLIMVAETSMIYTYVQLCYEDYNWWWNAFWVGACPALYLAADSIIRTISYLASGLGIRALMALICVNVVLATGLALVGGTVAFLAAFKYNQYIYG